MNFDFSDREEAFRKDVRGWLEANLPDDLRGRAFASSRAGRDEVRKLRAWQKRMCEAGYVGLDWPREFGGRGATIVEMVILYQEMARAESPQLVNRGGVSMLGPTLMKHGTPAQHAAPSREDPHGRRALVPGVLGAERGLRSREPPDTRRARRRPLRRERPEGLDQHGPRRRLVLPARPDRPDLRQAQGHQLPARRHEDAGHHGAAAARSSRARRSSTRSSSTTCACPSRTWSASSMRDGRVAITTLAYERDLLTFIRHISLRNALHRLVRLAQEQRKGSDPILRQKLAALWIGEQALQLNGYRSLTKILRGGAPGPEGSTSKLFWSQIDQELAQRRHRGHRSVLADRPRLDVGARRRPVGVLRAAGAGERHPRRHLRDPSQHPLRARPRAAQGLGATTPFAEEPDP